jgi:hypothetical protein
LAWTFQTNRPAEAEKAYLEVVGIDPFDPLPHAALLKTYAERPDPQRASFEKSSLAIVLGRATEAPTQGTLAVRSHPLARVFLDGVDTGRSTPIVSAPPGSHVVKIVNEERGFTCEQAVEIGAGDEKVLQLDAEEPSATPSSNTR